MKLSELFWISPITSSEALIQFSFAGPNPSRLGGVYRRAPIDVQYGQLLFSFIAILLSPSHIDKKNYYFCHRAYLTF